MNADLELALRLADVADATTLQRFRAADLRVEAKRDGTPVTDADTVTEQTLRSVLQEQRPMHAVTGEEYGVGGGSDWRWYIDPIDGTKNYSRGVPVWATLLALRHGDEPVCAVVSAPALSRRWWAARGEGAYAGDGTRLRVSMTAALDSAHISCTDVRDFARYGKQAGFDALLRQCRSVRAFGDFWSHMLVAEGAIDVGIEPIVNPWDIAPIQLIVEEAGGRFSDFAGGRRIDGGNVVTTNGLLHQAVLDVMTTD